MVRRGKPAKSTGASSHTAARRVAPLLPLAIALLSNAVIAPPHGKTAALGANPAVEAVACNESIEDFHACHSAYPTGCNASGRYDPYLNLLKNQTRWKSNQPKRFLTSLDDYEKLERQTEQLPGDGLGPGNHGNYLTQLAALGEGQIHGIIGYLYDAVPEGKESSNCQLDDDAEHGDVDFHIFIGFDEDIAGKLRGHKPLTDSQKSGLKKQAVIVEMTPQCCTANGREWTIDELRAVKGMQVKVLGQLMVDNEHDVKGQNCGRSDHTENCWRASAWELHPVTDFQACETGNCTATSTGWKPLTEEGPH
jgi:hypothetical protein